MQYYLVITGVTFDKKHLTLEGKPNVLYHVVAVDHEFTKTKDLGRAVEDYNIVNLIYTECAKPINFSLDRNSNIVADCGDFSRFSKLGSAVVLAELRSEGGRTLGFRLLSCANNIIVDLKTDDILAREASYGDEHFLQNGIIRNKTVNCYPMKPFNVIPIVKRRKHAKELQEMLDRMPTLEEASRMADGLPIERHKTSTERKKPVIKPKTEAELDAGFSKSQLDEISRCEKNGGDSRLIDNSKLSPQQMRVIWVSKLRGSLSESFANPNISVDAMKFYADRLHDKQTVADCKELLAHPELSVDELSELYACVCEGIPYTSYIGLSATEINVKRNEQSAEYWGSSKLFDPDYYEKALGVACKMKGY